MNKVKKIGFDLDGVLIDHQHNRVDLAQEFGYRDINADMSVREIKDRMKKDDFRQIQDFVYEEMSLRADIMKGSAEVLPKIKEHAELFIISRRNERSRQFALKWLQNNFNFLFPVQNIHFVDKDKEKGALAKKLNLDVFIDDKSVVLENIPDGIQKFLFDRFFMYKDKKISKIEVVHSFEEFFEKLGL